MRERQLCVQYFIWIASIVLPLLGSTADSYGNDALNTGWTLRRHPPPQSTFLSPDLRLICVMPSVCRYGHVAYILVTLHWLPLQERIAYKVALL